MSLSDRADAESRIDRVGKYSHDEPLNFPHIEFPMYQSYWQLDEKPFEAGCDPKFFFPGESHQAALLKLRYAVENRRGGALLAGASGLGKTLLIRIMQSMLAEQFAPLVHLVFPQMKADELLAYLSDELTGASDTREATPGVNHSVRRIQQFLTDNAQKDRHAVAIVDEAQLLTDPAVLDALRLLQNFEVDGRPTLTLLLVGQNGLLTTLDVQSALEERLDVKCLLRPFSRSETAAYVNHRIQTAGATRELFSADALDRLHDLTQGIPRRINRLADLALLIGFAEEFDSISAEHLSSVQQELVTVASQ